MKRRKLSALNKGQYETLWNLLQLLKDLRVFDDYHITDRQYYDTVMTFNNGYDAVAVDTQWQPLLEVEGIFITDGRADFN